MKNILVTGSEGFLGKNLKIVLANLKDVKVHTFDHKDNLEKLDSVLKEVDFIFHLAGVNRPQNEAEFEIGNTGLTEKIISVLLKNGKKTPLLLSSSSQAALSNPYGISKKKAEDAVFFYAEKSGADVFVFRLSNIFGKWCKPNYNSAVATFCHNIAHGLEVQISHPNHKLNLVYVTDVVEKFMETMKEGLHAEAGKIWDVQPSYTASLIEIVDLLNSFKKSRSDLHIADMSDEFTKKLYSTYLSYLPIDEFSYPLKMNLDERGSFTEFYKTLGRGQLSINVSKPGITRGNHWHHTKTEKFLVVSGKAQINFRLLGSDQITSYNVSSEKLEVVDIPTGYTHNIVNVGDQELVTVMWANEAFDPTKPDTHFLPV